MDAALVVGVEKYNRHGRPGVEAAVAQTGDYDYEAVQGMTPTAQAALLMQRYMHEYDVPRDGLRRVSRCWRMPTAVNNPNAMFRKAIRREAYDRAE